MSEIYEVLRREFVYVWYYFTVQLRQIAGYWAQYQRTYWHRTGFMCISQSWLEHGYEIKKLEIDHRRISFVQTQKGTSALKIPEVFLTQRIPNEAKFELENYFVHIKKKYGL